MKGFSFPPPPPPPPRATSQDGNPGGNAQPGGHGYRSARGGADRGRGRGRGRGSNHRGGHSGPRNNNHASMTGGFQPQNHYNGHALPSNAQQHQSQPFLPYGSPANFNALPTGGFINPAFTSAYTNYVNTNPLASSWNPATAQQQQQSFPLNTNAIANNSVNSSVGPLQGSNRPLQSKPKPTSKPKVAAPPVVPSFGFQLPTVKPELPTESPSNKSKKRKFNQLGLTPRGDVHEDSEEDDANEEAKFTTGVLQFEYKGRSSTLKTSADIAAWIAERKKQYPTKARALEKQKAEEEARKAREETRSNAEASAERENKHKSKESPANKRTKKSDDRKAMEKHLAKAEKLRKKLERAEAKIKGAVQVSPKDPSEAQGNAVADLKTEASAPATSLKANLVDYDSEDDEVDSDAESSVVSSDSSDLSSDTDSDSSSDDDSDSDAPPEEESSAKRPIKVAPPARKPRAPQPKQTKKETKRMTLRERLVEQEQQQEAEMALEAIKFLGDQGMLGQ
ncbi:hypothetical protein HDK90DRAFT_522280 [Phyllosticta capitalensis]|uniref:FMR1-interacting protein 1 conserved domain-containing protein n=2 Tax=Phyllosticta capitalensis TaxID=121624 RepID=A0ABR1YYE7_9PEZI